MATDAQQNWRSLGAEYFDFSKVTGWQAHSFAFWESPHRTFVLRLQAPQDQKQRLYLYCITCRRIEIDANWIVESLRYLRKDDEQHVVEDTTKGNRIVCSCAVMFNETLFKKWLGDCAWMTNPSQDDLRRYFEKISKTFD
jgi:hypothetical protein